MSAFLPPDAVPVEKEILDFFADRNFERSRRFAPDAYKPENLRAFLAKLGNPQLKYKTIHVVGTVGKGSATTYLARALTAMGFKTGAYLSPHFVSLTERFVIDGEPIGAITLAELWHELKSDDEIHTLSFFDAMTALGFLYFARSECNWAVVEAGLGGRLDSTNNLKAAFAVITRVGLDHQNILGDTLEKIAAEKAGIIQKGQRVYSPPQRAEALAVLRQTAAEKAAELIVVEKTGDTFVENNRDFALQVIADAMHPTANALAQIERVLLQPVFGRWSILKTAPRIIFDGGHNAEAMTALVPLVNRQPEAECNIFLNTMRERDLARFCEVLRAGIQKKLSLFLLPVANAKYYDTPPTGSGLQAVTESQVAELLQAPDALHLFTGSMALYAEMRSRFAL
jgi:dihydrofolate synthase / folylpolyglutamate synthase